MLCVNWVEFPMLLPLCKVNPNEVDFVDYKTKKHSETVFEND